MAAALFAKLKGKYFTIKGIKKNEKNAIIYCNEKITWLKTRKQYKIVILSCKVKENNQTLIVKVKQQETQTLFISSMPETQLYDVKDSGIILIHNTFYDTDSIGRTYIYNNPNNLNQNDYERQLGWKRRKIAHYGLRDQDGGYSFSRNTNFQVFNKETIGKSVTNLVGKEMTVSTKKEDDNMHSELNVKISADSRREIANLIKILVQNFPQWKSKPSVKNTKGATGILKYTRETPYWIVNRAEDGSVRYINEITKEQTSVKPDILKWEQVFVLADERKDNEKTNKVYFNTDNQYAIDKIEVLQNNDVGIDDMIEILNTKATVRDNKLANKCVKILERIEKKLKGNAYRTTKSFNDDKFRVRGSLQKDEWKDPIPLTYDDLRPLFQNCCYVRFTCNNMPINKIAHIMNNNKTNTVGVLIMPKGDSKEKNLYLKVQKPVFNDDGSIHFDYKSPGNSFEDIASPTNRILAFNAKPFKPHDEYEVDLPGYFNLVPKADAVGLNSLVSNPQALNDKTFLYVKRHVTKVKENAIKYYNTVQNGTIQIKDVEKMYAEFLTQFHVIFTRFQLNNH
jgi:hypothetical protein